MIFIVWTQVRKPFLGVSSTSQGVPEQSYFGHRKHF
jgi:hypothetical protein